MRKPVFTMLVGLPGSGKSVCASTFEANIHSSDDIRVELFGNVNDQRHNNKVFDELHKRVKNDLLNGIDCVYDATNISSKYRIAFLKELKNIDCYKMCIIMATTYEDCKERIQNRDRIVPIEILDRMYKNFCPPYYHEGWDQIHIEYANTCNLHKYTLERLYDPVNGIDNFDQQNSHHSLSLGEHCKKATKYILNNYPYDILVADAAMIHDEGKIFTKSEINGKGVNDGNYHYYQHHCVGSYNSLFYLVNEGYDKDDILYISNLIYFHMHPYLQWKDSERKKEKDRNLIGEKMFNDVLHLHEGDLYAH